jgi:hypothetical protein
MVGIGLEDVGAFDRKRDERAGEPTLDEIELRAEVPAFAGDRREEPASKPKNGS